MPAKYVSPTFRYLHVSRRTAYDWARPMMGEMVAHEKMARSRRAGGNKPRPLKHSMSQISCLSDHEEAPTPMPGSNRHREANEMAAQEVSNRTYKPAGLPPAPPPVWPKFGAPPPDRPTAQPTASRRSAAGGANPSQNPGELANGSDQLARSSHAARPRPPRLEPMSLAPAPSAASLKYGFRPSSSASSLRAVSSTSSLSSALYRPLSSVGERSKDRPWGALRPSTSSSSMRSLVEPPFATFTPVTAQNQMLPKAATTPPPPVWWGLAAGPG